MLKICEVLEKEVEKSRSRLNDEEFRAISQENSGSKSEEFHAISGEGNSGFGSEEFHAILEEENFGYDSNDEE